jgi:hypothetical protein
MTLLLGLPASALVDESVLPRRYHSALMGAECTSETSVDGRTSQKMLSLINTYFYFTFSAGKIIFLRYFVYCLYDLFFRLHITLLIHKHMFTYACLFSFYANCLKLW